MARVKRGVTAHAKHKKILKKAKGYYGRRKNTIRIAKQAVEKAMQYGYRDRKRKKRTFRALWIQRINAAVREHGLTYGRFINGLAQRGHRRRPQGAGRPRRQGRGRLQGARATRLPPRSRRRRSVSSRALCREDPATPRDAARCDGRAQQCRRQPAECWIPGTSPGMTTDDTDNRPRRPRERAHRRDRRLPPISRASSVCASPRSARRGACPS